VAQQYSTPTAKHSSWGKGFRSRREVVKKALAVLSLPTEWLYHGVKREIFAVPLAENSSMFLNGSSDSLSWYDSPASDIADFFKRRWLMPRSLSDSRFRGWRHEEWRLWT
jgi:hypothetical protein